MTLARHRGALLPLLCFAIAGPFLLAAMAHAADAPPAAPFDVHAATEAYLRSLPAADRLKSDAYFAGGYWLILWNALYAIGVSVVLLVTGASARLRDAAFRIGRRRWIANAAYGLFYVVAVALLTFPIDIYQGYFREHQYGLSNQNLAAWSGDTLIELAISAVSAALVLPIIYAVIRRAPGRWWLYGSVVATLFLVFSVIIGPTFVEPLLNHFQPIADGPLKQQILAMARADSVPAHDVLEYDNSRQTNRVSAHVSGLFGTTQISLNDNLIKQCTPDQVLAVVGHEMGHYVMGHVFNFVLFLALIVAFGLAICGAAMRSILRSWGPRWGLGGQEDIASLPVLVACLTAYFFVLTPVLNTLTRMQEMQADIFGLNLARRPDAFAQAALKLSTYRKLEPTALEEIIFYDHPSGRTRILTAMRWKAEQALMAPTAAVPDVPANR